MSPMLHDKNNNINNNQSNSDDDDDDDYVDDDDVALHAVEDPTPATTVPYGRQTSMQNRQIIDS